MPLIITVDRDGIDKGRKDTIRIENSKGGIVTATEAQLSGDVVVRTGPPRQDGARVWIEAQYAYFLDAAGNRCAAS